MNTNPDTDRAEKILFSGDWWLDDAANGYEHAFEAVAMNRYGSFAEIVVERDVLDAIVSAQEQFVAEYGDEQDRLVMREDGVLLHFPGDGDEADIAEYHPDEDGRYSIDFGWIWDNVTEDDNVANLHLAGRTTLRFEVEISGPSTLDADTVRGEISGFLTAISEGTIGDPDQLSLFETTIVVR